MLVLPSLSRFVLMETLRCFFIWRASDGLKRVRIPKRGAKLGGDGVWTTTNMWRSWTYWWIFVMFGGERVVTLEPHPRHVDLLKINVQIEREISSCYVAERTENWHLWWDAIECRWSHSIQKSYDAAGICWGIPVFIFLLKVLRDTWRSPLLVRGRLKRCVRYIYGHSRWSKSSQSEERYTDLVSTLTATGR